MITSCQTRPAIFHPCARHRASAQQLWAQLPSRSPPLFSSRSLPLLMNTPLPQNDSNKARQRDEAQTNRSSRPILYASGSANPSIGHLPVPPNPADRLTPIGHARRGRKKYVPFIPSRPNQFTSTIEMPLEYQPIQVRLTHEPPSTHISNTFQGSDQLAPLRLDLAAPRAVAPYKYDLILNDSRRQLPPVAQTRTMRQGINAPASPRPNFAIPNALLPCGCRSAPDSPIHRPPSPAPPIAIFQGTTAYVSQPSLINTSDLSRPSNWSTAVCAS